MLMQIAAPGRVHSQRLPRSPESARCARRLVSQALDSWGLGALEDSGWLVVTELVSNAVAHAELDTVRVTVTRMSPDVVRVAVLDRSSTLPRRQAAGPDSECGRGLDIVAALSGGRWGAQRREFGKCVWAELSVTSEGT